MCSALSAAVKETSKTEDSEGSDLTQCGCWSEIVCFILTPLHLILMWSKSDTCPLVCTLFDKKNNNFSACNRITPGF